jgi:hypothetical protein
MASFVLPIISGLAGLFGGSSTKQTTQQAQSQTNTSNSGTTSGSTTPNLSPLQQQLSQMFGSEAQSIFNPNATAATLQGYETGGLQQIGQAGQAQNQVLNNILASRGLGSSPVAATANTMNEQNQINQSQQLLSSLPLLARQMAQQNIQGLTSAFSALPTGVSTTGTSTNTGQTNFTGSGTQTTSTPGGWLSGLLGGLGAGLAAPGSNGNSNLNNIITSLGGGPNTTAPSNPGTNGGMT